MRSSILFPSNHGVVLNGGLAVDRRAGVAGDDGVDAEESLEQGVRRGGEHGFKQEMGNAERDVLP